MRLRSVAAVALAVCCTSCGASLLGPPPAQDRASLFDSVWREFDLHYSFFELKQVDWTAVGARYRPAALAARTDADFAAVLGRMLAELRDVHVSITPFGAGSTIRYVSPFEMVSTDFNSLTLFSRYVPASSTTSGGHIRLGVAAPGVWYMAIPSFVGSDWSGEMDEALALIGDADAVVIDVRNNGGGNKSIAGAIAGRFADRERTFGYVRLRNGPRHSDFSDEIAETVRPEGARRFSNRVIVMTNRRSYSSAENFVLAMRTLPTVTIVGDTTGGASGGPLVRELPNGWTYQLSQWIEYTPDHKVYEGIGLAPSIVVNPATTFAVVGHDAALERAVAIARAEAPRATRN